MLINFYCLAFQLLAHIFYSAFIKNITKNLIGTFLFTLLELELFLFFSKKLVYIITLIIVLVLKNMFLSFQPFAKAGYYRIGMAFGSAITSILFFTINKSPILFFEPKNYWIFNR